MDQELENGDAALLKGTGPSGYADRVLPDSIDHTRPRSDSRPLLEPDGQTRPGKHTRFFDYIFLARPMILIPVWTFFLLGAYHAGISGPVEGKPIELISGLTAFTLLLGAIYIINQITDRRSDLANNKLFLISQSIVSLKAAWIETVSLVAASFITGWLFLPPRFVLILVLSLILGVLYSIEPVRLKKRPFLDVLANAAGNGILNTLAGWIAAGAPLSGWTVLLPYPLAVASVHLSTTLADIEGDRDSGLRTSGVALGMKKGIIISASLMAAASVAAALSGNKLALYATLLSLPAYFIKARTGDDNLPVKDPLLPARMATLIFSVAAGLFFKFYLPLLAIVIFCTRIYYKRRFGVKYPSLRT